MFWQRKTRHWTGNEILSLLGARVASSEVRSLFRVLGERPEVEDDRELDERYFYFSRKGIEIIATSDGRITTAMLHGNDERGSGRFAGQLPHSLTFSMSRAVTRSQLGTPSTSRQAGTEVEVLGPVQPYDVYDLPTHTVHIEFAEDMNSITMVTLMVADSAPGREERE